MQIPEVIDKAGGMFFRCCCAGSTLARWRDIPAWMFERSVCLAIRYGAAPFVDVDALRSLVTLLRDATPVAPWPLSATRNFRSISIAIFTPDRQAAS